MKEECSGAVGPCSGVLGLWKGCGEGERFRARRGERFGAWVRCRWGDRSVGGRGGQEGGGGERVRARVRWRGTASARHTPAQKLRAASGAERRRVTGRSHAVFRPHSNAAAQPAGQRGGLLIGARDSQREGEEQLNCHTYQPTLGGAAGAFWGISTQSEQITTVPTLKEYV